MSSPHSSSFVGINPHKFIFSFLLNHDPKRVVVKQSPIGEGSYGKHAWTEWAVSLSTNNLRWSYTTTDEDTLEDELQSIKNYFFERMEALKNWGLPTVDKRIEEEINLFLEKFEAVMTEAEEKGIDDSKEALKEGILTELIKNDFAVMLELAEKEGIKEEILSEAVKNKVDLMKISDDIDKYNAEIEKWIVDNFETVWQRVDMYLQERTEIGREIAELEENARKKAEQKRVEIKEALMKEEEGKYDKEQAIAEVESKIAELEEQIQQFNEYEKRLQQPVEKAFSNIFKSYIQV